MMSQKFDLSFRGAAAGREPEIHNPGAAEYGFRARRQQRVYARLRRAMAASRNDEY